MSLRPLEVSVVELLRRPGSRHNVVASLDLEDDMALHDVVIPAGTALGVDVVVESMSDGITVTGTVTAQWSGICRRCLAAAGEPINAEVREIYQFKPNNDEAFELDSSVLDLEPMARQAALLELPIGPLCRAECAGLCAECGVNLNDHTCSCDTTPIDVRWAGLDLLKGNLPES